MKRADRIADRQALYRKRMTELAAFRRTQPCKDRDGEVRGDGSCLRCDAENGEACRDPTAEGGKSGG